MVKTHIDEGITYAKMNNIGELKHWLDSDNDPNQYDEQGFTPLLWACARGNHESVKLLIERGADTQMRHRESDGLPIHLAGHSGDVETAKALLEHNMDDLNAVWDLNGHTVLLQASFYGHLDLARYLVTLNPDTSITTARGLGPMEMAAQFHNHAMMEIIKPYDVSADEKARYYQSYLDRIKPMIPERDKEKQALSDELVSIIENGLKETIANPEASMGVMDSIKELIENKHAEVNRLGGILQQPPIVVATTGNNGFPVVPEAEHLREEICAYLLEHGADPTMHEVHPMGVQTIIRAAVFNHLKILRMCANHMSQKALTDSINEIPVVNGLTALHDTVLRASTSDEAMFPTYLEQARWFMENGGRSDIEDFSGVTQKDIAMRCKNETYKAKLLEVL